MQVGAGGNWTVGPSPPREIQRSKTFSKDLKMSLEASNYLKWRTPE